MPLVAALPIFRHKRSRPTVTKMSKCNLQVYNSTKLKIHYKCLGQKG